MTLTMRGDRTSGGARVARTPHYDSVKKGAAAPAVIGIFGQAPIDFKFVDPSVPPWWAA